MHQAVDQVTKQRVAVKMLRTDSGIPDARARFDREVRLLSSISHPNCVRLLDRGSDPHPFAVMELVAGNDLRDAMSRPLPVEQVLDLSTQILRGLEALHARNIVHRDIKPENIMLTRLFDGSDRVVLVDFGAAIDANAPEDTGTGAALTAVGFVLGTPPSMSPEQLAGDGATRSADIYAAGVLMFEMLVGRMPFPQQDLGELLRAKRQPPPRLPAIVPPAVSHYVGWLMQQRPEDRPRSCTEALAGLEYAREVTRRSHTTRTFFDLLGPAYAVETPANGGTQRSGTR